MVILGAAAVLVICVVLPQLVSGTALTILTGSMRPSMPPGTLVVIRPVAAQDIRIGDVVTYQIDSGQPTVATHRVVGTSFDGRGQRTFTTRGDANGSDDPQPVRPVQIRGEEWYHVPYVGYVNSLLSGQQRGIGRLVIAGALLSYAAWMIAGAVRERRRKRTVVA